MIDKTKILKCGSPLGEYELHLTKEGLNDLLKRDEAMDKILKLRDYDGSLDMEAVMSEIVEITKELKNERRF